MAIPCMNYLFWAREFKGRPSWFLNVSPPFLNKFQTVISPLAYYDGKCIFLHCFSLYIFYLYLVFFWHNHFCVPHFHLVNSISFTRYPLSHLSINEVLTLFNLSNQNIYLMNYFIAGESMCSVPVFDRACIWTYKLLWCLGLWWVVSDTMYYHCPILSVLGPVALRL